MGDDGCCGENAELSTVDGQSLPTVTNEYRSIGSGLENSKRKKCVSRGLMVGVQKLTYATENLLVVHCNACRRIVFIIPCSKRKRILMR